MGGMGERKERGLDAELLALSLVLDIFQHFAVSYVVPWKKTEGLLPGFLKLGGHTACINDKREIQNDLSPNVDQTTGWDLMG